MAYICVAIKKLIQICGFSLKIIENNKKIEIKTR